MTGPSDFELVDAYLAKGQDTAYIELVRRHQIPVFRRLSVELSDPDDAETVCEVAFLVASQRLSEWPKETEFRSWVLEVASEVGASRRGSPVDRESPRLVDPAVYFRQSVHRALQTLEPAERTALLAVDLEGQTPEAFASESGIDIAHVTQTLARARATFTAAMNERAPSEDGGQAKVPNIEPGAIVDNRYRVEELLGEGGMASVFRAEHLGIKRHVALKTLRPTRRTQRMIRERFVREAEVLGRLAHPNFVDVSDFGESAQGIAYLVMELLSGRPLSAELADGGSMHPARALSIVREVARGLSYAHSLGIIHRDIKPDNVVLVGEDGSRGFAKILDLGVAATSDEAQREGGVLFGTPQYMAPEQVQGSRIDGRVDLYATGIMLFELLTGEVPFHGATVEFILAQQISLPVPPLRDLVEDLPEGEAIQALLDRCVAKDPNKRFPNADALIAALDELLVTLGDAPLGSMQPRKPPADAFAPTVAKVHEKGSSLGTWIVLTLLAVVVALVAWWRFGR